MRNRLRGAPRWVVAACAGVPFGITMAVFAVVMLANLAVAGRICAALVMGIVAGVSFGLPMEWLVHREARRRQDAVGHLPDAQRRLAVRSASRGPAPADDVVRHAALRIAKDALDNRWWRLNVATFSALSAYYVLLALTRSPWWWFACALFASGLALQIISHRRVRRRVAILSAAPPVE